MKFEEAKRELKRLAGGKYYSIGYHLTEYPSGTLEAECYLYVDPKISVSASNWNDALTKMEVLLKKNEPPDLSEMPEEEEAR